MASSTPLFLVIFIYCSPLSFISSIIGISVSDTLLSFATGSSLLFAILDYFLSFIAGLDF